MGHSAGHSATRRRRRGPIVALVAVATAALCAGAASTLLVGCGGGQTAPPPAISPQATGLSSQATGAPPVNDSPSPIAVVTSGPVPPGAARAATRCWRLIDAHRYRALLTVVTRDSQAAAAVRAGGAAAFWGIERVRVVSVEATVEPAPPAGATLEFAMTIDVRPAQASAWTAGRNLVFMSLRRAGGSWLVYEAGSGP